MGDGEDGAFLRPEDSVFSRFYDTQSPLGQSIGATAQRMEKLLGPRPIPCIKM